MSDTNLDAMEFRNALGAFTTGVTIITAVDAEGEPVGVTANSFNSVSLDPPLVLWSLAKNAASLPVFQESEYFAIHILAADQEDLSNRFAKRGEDKFKNLDLATGLGGVPLLNGCCVCMQCKTTYRYEGGDHIIFVGEVMELSREDAAPLVFQAGKYAVAGRKADEAPLISAGSHENSSFREDFLGYLLWRAYFQFHNMARKQAAIADHNDAEFLVLVTLFDGTARTHEELSSVMSHDRDSAQTTVAISSLAEQGLIETSNEGKASAYGLTEQGREKTLLILAAAKSTEADFLDKLGLWQSVAFKNLLKQFIVETDPGLPHLWESDTHTAS